MYVIEGQCFIYDHVMPRFHLILNIGNAGIMDTAIVEKGRNIVSVSRDGTAKLWDCGQSQCLTTFEDTGGSINACAVGAVSQDISLGNSSLEHSEKSIICMPCIMYA